MEKPHHYRCAAKLFDAKPFRLAAFREYRQSKYVLEHILRPSIHPHLKQQMFGFGRTAVEGDANSARQQCEPLRSFSLRQ
jgi:hypothetical protein